MGALMIPHIEWKSSPSDIITPDKRVLIKPIDRGEIEEAKSITPAYLTAVIAKIKSPL